MLLGLSAAVFLLQCDTERPNDSVRKTSGGVELLAAGNPHHNETALFLAGMELPRESSLYQYTQTKEYQSYKRHTGASWERFQLPNQRKIEKWMDRHLSGDFSNTIFYPFSGPDICNALVFFPEGMDYIMFGLESPGEIPRPHSLAPSKLYPGLTGLSAALNNVLNVNYFKTVEMERGVSTNSFNSIVSLIMFFLGRSGYEVVDAQRIWINEHAALTAIAPSKKGGKMIAGAEILFRKSKGDRVKRVRYFQLNVIDHSLNTYTNFIPFLRSYPRFTTIIKSASYLMHNEKKFIQIRDLTLSHSDYILQDDSGIALRYFSPEFWRLSFHGIYTRPVPLFAHRYQTDFAKSMKEKSSGPLPFSYGYNFRENESNLMLAERIKR